MKTTLDVTIKATPRPFGGGGYLIHSVRYGTPATQAVVAQMKSQLRDDLEAIR